MYLSLNVVRVLRNTIFFIFENYFFSILMTVVKNHQYLGQGRVGGEEILEFCIFAENRMT
jgi:hypothetical protein